MSLCNQIRFEGAATQWTGVAGRIYELSHRVLYAMTAIMVSTKLMSSVKCRWAVRMAASVDRVVNGSLLHSLALLDVRNRAKNSLHRSLCE